MANSDHKEVARQSIRLSDGRRGYGLGDLSSQSDLMRDQRLILEQLVGVPEASAKSFFQSLGISSPRSFAQSSVDHIFANLRSIAKRGPLDGEAVFFSLGGAGKQFICVRHVDNSGFESALLACKLSNGSYLVYNTVGVPEELGI